MDFTYASQERIEHLKERVQRCVCKYCGNALKLKRIVFSEYEEARIEIFCGHCDRIEFGVEPEIYACAQYFVEEMEFNYYPDLEESEAVTQMNIAKVSEMTAWMLKKLALLDEEGFKTTIKLPQKMLAQCVLFNNADLAEINP